nr:hypothetical protein [Pelobacter propionicus]
MNMKSNVIPFAQKRKNCLQPLNIPVPPTLEEAICYPGEERYVALWWTRCGEDIVYDDGLCSGTGYSYGWLAYARHAIVAPILSRLDYMDFDLRDAPAKERLLLDRYKRCFMFGPTEFVMISMKTGNNITEYDCPLIELSVDQLAEINDAFGKITSFTSKELERRVEEHHRQIRSMLTWLDELQASRGV